MKLVDRQKCFFAVVFIGFIIGILYTNLFALDYMAITGIFSTYYLQGFVSSEIIVGEYLFSVLKVRILPLCVLLIIGYCRLNKVGVVLFLGWTGFLWGIYMSLGVVQLGVVGVLICVLGIFPQVVFYIPAYFIVMVWAYNRPESQWNIMKMAVMILCTISGIVLECRMNPQILKWLITVIG